MKESESEAPLCPTLCNPMDCNLPGSSIHGIFQARVLEWVAISPSRRSSQPRDWIWVSCIVGRHFRVWATREAIYIYIVMAHWDKRWSYPSPEMTSLDLWLPKSCPTTMPSTRATHSRHNCTVVLLRHSYAILKQYSYGTITLPGHNRNARLREAFTKQIRPIQDNDIWFLFGLQESRVSIFLWMC